MSLAPSTAIRRLRPGGGTAMYDAIYFACRDKLSQDQPKHKFRRAMVVLSDGDDTGSWLVSINHTATEARLGPEAQVGHGKGS